MSDKEKSCCFFGDIIISDSVKPRLRKEVRSAIEKGYRAFYVGCHGAFDQAVLDVLKAEKTLFPDILIHRVLYPQRRIELGYSERDPEGIQTVIIGNSEAPYAKRIKTNYRRIAEICSLAICCTHDHPFFGLAYEAVQYAAEIGLKTINVLDERELRDYRSLK